MTAHVDTGEPLPRALFDKMLAAKNFQSGLQTLRQLEFACSTCTCIHDFDPAGGPHARCDLLDEMRTQGGGARSRRPTTASRTASRTSSPAATRAGYYSYKWAEVLSADAYSLFEEATACSIREPAQRFRDEILAVGGSRPAMESFRAFRGREPTIDALLRHNGMA